MSTEGREGPESPQAPARSRKPLNDGSALPPSMAEEEFPPRKEKTKTQIRATAEEFRKSVVQSLTTAFGLVIALVWNQVVQGGFAVAGVGLTVGQTTPLGWLLYMISAVIITIASVVMIVLLSRWGGKK